MTSRNLTVASNTRTEEGGSLVLKSIAGTQVEGQESDKVREKVYFAWCE